MRTNDILGRNLRVLLDRRGEAVAAACREMGVNRTQFNRYLGMESWPRPDVLKRICDHFETDARILHEPLAELEDRATHYCTACGAITVQLDENREPETCH